MESTRIDFLNNHDSICAIFKGHLQYKDTEDKEKGRESHATKAVTFKRGISQ